MLGLPAHIMTVNVQTAEATASLTSRASYHKHPALSACAHCISDVFDMSAPKAHKRMPDVSETRKTLAFISKGNSGGTATTFIVTHCSTALSTNYKAAHVQRDCL